MPLGGPLRGRRPARYHDAGGPTVNEAPGRRRGWSWWYLLFLVQFLAVLWPPFYNSVQPAWHGIPFFYWYQMLCVLVSAVVTAVVYLATEG